MNERINKLKEQAKEKVISHGAYGETEIYWEINVDKFAELILQEHVELLKQRWYTLNNIKPPSDESPRDMGMRVGQKIEVQQCIQLLLNHWKDS